MILIVKIFIQFIGNREILSFFIFLNFPTYDNACNGQTCSPVWVRVKGTSASGTEFGQCNEYYYMSTDELYNLGFSLVY